jgi:DNA-binding PadR family transcriptional regulator
VISRSEFSAQTLSVLAALCAQPSAWQHGYAIARDTGLKSGTLYPILIRLADRGLMEALWEEEQPAGRPRRHLYRLTPEGLARAGAALAAAPSPARAGLSPRRRLAVPARP